MPDGGVAGLKVSFDADVVEHLAAVEYRAHVRLTGHADDLPDYAELGEAEKDLNRASARSIPAKLGHVGLHAVWASGQDEEPLELTAQEIEDMARAEHDRWIEHTVGRGYTWGPTRDENAVPPTHPDLVPYAPMSDEARRSHYPPAVVSELGPGHLDEAAREKDRIRVRNLPATLMKAGIALKRSEP